MKSFLLLGALALQTALLCAQPAIDTPLAVVASTIITRGEFRARTALLDEGDPCNPRNFLNCLIAEKLLALEAASRNMEHEREYQESIRRIERLLVRDELFRKEIREKIILCDDEIRAAMQKLGTEISVYFLYAPEKKTADDAGIMIRNGKSLESFDETGSGPSLLEGPDSAQVRWGSGDERVEDIVFALHPGETSNPVHLDDGYYLFKVMGKRDITDGSAADQKRLRRKAETIVRDRRERNAALEYMDTVLKNKKASANAKIFRVVAAILFDIAREHSRSRDTLSPFILSTEVAEAIRQKIPSLWDTVFVVFPHTTWTLGEMIDRLVTSRLMIEDPSPVILRSALDQRMRDIIDQEHLTQEAYAQNLQSSASVKTDIRLWREAYLSATILRKLKDSVNANLAHQNAGVQADRIGPLLKLRTILVDSISTAREIQGLLRDGTSFTDLMYRYSTDDNGVQSIGREQFQQVADSTPTGEAVFRLKAGSIAPPVKTAFGYQIIHVLDRKDRVSSVRDSTAGTDPDVQQAVGEMYFREFLAGRLRVLAARYRISITANNAAEAEGDHIALPVYRMLGFGGRMLTVPPIDPQIRSAYNWNH